MKVALYLRVSTDRQAEQGLGLEVQERACRAWLKANGHRLAGVYRDEGVSGSNGLEARSGLHDALSALRTRAARGLVVYRLDRLARDLILQEQLLAEIRRMDAELFSTSAAEADYLTDDPDDPSRRLIRQVLGAVSEYERAMISLRLRAGRRRKSERGEFAYGSPALGYRAEARELVPVPEEQETVARIHELRVHGASLREICAVMESERRSTKRGGRWAPNTVRRVLARQER